MKSTGVIFRDKSSNGIWVNSHKVGKVNMWSLEHNSEICFAGSDKKVFVFMSREATADSFSTELTTKCTVNKGLGKGACGEVRLGFRVSELNRVVINVICKRKIITTFYCGDSSTKVLSKVQIL